MPVVLVHRSARVGANGRRIWCGFHRWVIPLSMLYNALYTWYWTWTVHWPGRVWLVPSMLGTGKSLTFFYSVQYIIERVQNVVELSLCFTGIKEHNQILCFTSVVLIEFYHSPGIKSIMRWFRRFALASKLGTYLLLGGSLTVYCKRNTTEFGVLWG